VTSHSQESLHVRVIVRSPLSHGPHESVVVSPAPGLHAPSPAHAVQSLHSPHAQSAEQTRRRVRRPQLPHSSVCVSSSIGVHASGVPQPPVGAASEDGAPASVAPASAPPPSGTPESRSARDQSPSRSRWQPVVGIPSTDTPPASTNDATNDRTRPQGTPSTASGSAPGHRG